MRIALHTKRNAKNHKNKWYVVSAKLKVRLRKSAEMPDQARHDIIKILVTLKSTMSS